MPSRFSLRERRVTAAIDAEYGEMTRITPYARGEFTTSADPTRQIRDVIGIPDFVPSQFLPKDTSRFDGMQPMVSGDQAHVSYDEAKLGARADWPKQGDRITLVEQPGQPMFMIVTSPESDGMGRVVCKVMPTT